MERNGAGTAGNDSNGLAGAIRTVLAAVLVLLLCALAMRRNHDWRNDVTLMEDTIRKTPEKPRTYYNLGCEYSDLHRYRAAAKMFSKSIELYRMYNSADDERSRDFYFYAYWNRGTAYARAGSPDKAIEDYTRAIFLRPERAETYLDRGACYRRSHSSARAASDFRKACELGSAEGCQAVSSAPGKARGPGSQR